MFSESLVFFFLENNLIFEENRVTTDCLVVWGKFYFLRLRSKVNFTILICQEEEVTKKVVIS